MINGIELEAVLALFGWAMFLILFLFGLINKDALVYARQLRKKADIKTLNEIADNIDIVELKSILKKSAFLKDMEDATGQGEKPEKQNEIIRDLKRSLKN